MLNMTGYPILLAHIVCSPPNLMLIAACWVSLVFYLLLQWPWIWSFLYPHRSDPPRLTVVEMQMGLQLLLWLLLAVDVATAAVAAAAEFGESFIWRCWCGDARSDHCGVEAGFETPTLLLLLLLREGQTGFSPRHYRNCRSYINPDVVIVKITQDIRQQGQIHGHMLLVMTALQRYGRTDQLGHEIADSWLNIL